jgi:hypothetical protein
VSATLTGIIIEGRDATGKPALEICPRERIEPCPGVILQGTIAPEHISKPGRITRARARGSYDGDRLVVHSVESLGPAERDHGVDAFRNPCLEYQSPKPGPVNGSQSIADLTHRLNTEYEDRVAGIVWDRPRKTLTVRLTGDISGLREKLNIKPDDRVCLVGGSPRAMKNAAELVNELGNRMRQTEALFVGGGVNAVSGAIEMSFEALDRQTRALLEKEVGRGANLHAFIELTDASLSEMPLPTSAGALPLATGTARSESAMMQALGRFELHVDERARCVYLADHAQQRLMPILPFGYRVEDDPLRLVDFDGNVVATGGKVVDWGGGNTGAPSGSFAKYACGADRTWIGRPNSASRLERAP